MIDLDADFERAQYADCHVEAVERAIGRRLTHREREREWHCAYSRLRERRKSPRPVPCGEDGIGYGVSVVGAVALLVCMVAAPLVALVALWIYGGGR